jgi:hypothetical protein
MCITIHFYHGFAEASGYCDGSDVRLLMKLVCFILSSVCFRYEDTSQSSFDYPSHDQGIRFGNDGDIASVLHPMKLLFNLSMIKYPSLLSSSITKWSIVLFSELHFTTFCFMRLNQLIQRNKGIIIPVKVRMNELHSLSIITTSFLIYSYLHLRGASMKNSRPKSCSCNSVHGSFKCHTDPSTEIGVHSNRVHLLPSKFFLTCH